MIAAGRSVKTTVGCITATHPTVAPLSAKHAVGKHPSHRSRLRHRPLERLRLIISFRTNHSQILNRTPECAGAVAISQMGRCVNIGNLHIIGCGSEAGYMHVERNIYQSCFLIFPGLEQQGIAVGIHLMSEESTVYLLQIGSDRIHIVGW